MRDALNIAFGVFFLFVAVWVLVFGGIGVLLARAREVSGIAGFAYGALLGPIGWGVVLWKGRKARRTIDAANFLGQHLHPPLPNEAAVPPAASGEVPRLPSTGSGHDW